MKICIKNRIILAFICTLAISTTFSSCKIVEKEKKLHITIDGKEYDGIDINENGITKIDTKYGYNEILVSDMNIRVIKSDCPDKICVKKGFINKNMKDSDMIICAPHRLCISFY